MSTDGRVPLVCPLPCCERSSAHISTRVNGQRFKSDIEMYNHMMFQQAQMRGVVWYPKDRRPSEAASYELQGPGWAVDNIRSHDLAGKNPYRARPATLETRSRPPGLVPLSEVLRWRADQAQSGKDGAQRIARQEVAAPESRHAPPLAERSPEPTLSDQNIGISSLYDSLRYRERILDDDGTPFSTDKTTNLKAQVISSRTEINVLQQLVIKLISKGPLTGRESEALQSLTTMPLVDGDGEAFDAFRQLQPGDLSKISGEQAKIMLIDERKRNLALENVNEKLWQDTDRLAKENTELRKDNGEMRLGLRGDHELLTARLEGRDEAARRAALDAAGQAKLPQLKRKFKAEKTSSLGGKKGKSSGLAKPGKKKVKIYESDDDDDAIDEFNNVLAGYEQRIERLRNEEGSISMSTRTGVWNNSWLDDEEENNMRLAL